MKRLDFVQAAHELFRRHPIWLRHSPMLYGLYIGMEERELREYLVERDEAYFIEDIERAQIHGDWVAADGYTMQTQRPSNGRISTYHLSLWWVIEHDPFTVVLADRNPLGKHLSWQPEAA